MPSPVREARAAAIRADVPRSSVIDAIEFVGTVPSELSALVVEDDIYYRHQSELR